MGDRGPQSSGRRRQRAAPQHRRISTAAHHRRRRRAALLGLVAVAALVIGIVLSSGGGGSGEAAKIRPSGPHTWRQRLVALSSPGPRSLAAKQRDRENAAIARTLKNTPAIRRAGTQHRELALTFDDGPGPFTPKVRKILRRFNVPATFFEVGIMEKDFGESTEKQAREGFEIGDHTVSHPNLAQLSIDQQREQIMDAAKAIEDHGAPRPRLLRPPYGAFNDDTIKLAHELKMLIVLWSAETSDYELPGVKTIIERALDAAKPGAIILMHDAGGQRQQTVDALPSIIRGLRKRGYKLVTVPQLILDNPPPANADMPEGRPSAAG